MTGSSRKPALGVLQLALSLVVLVAMLGMVDTQQISARLYALDPGWAIAALILVSLQLMLMAARWLSIARTLGVPLGYRRALREYYVSTLLNQVMPFGVMGDALRAVRHTHSVRRSGARQVSGGRVVMAILVERASGQLALYVIAISLIFFWWPSLAPRAASHAGGLALLIGSVMGTGITLGVALRLPRLYRFREALGRGARVLFVGREASVHWLISLALIAAHVAVFCCAARALGYSLDFGSAFRVVPLVLIVASLPAFFAGWGAREAAAAWLFHAIGMSATEGVAVSLVFGALTLVATAPGVFALRTR
jgi:glycosyltransferase 2 family protein